MEPSTQTNLTYIVVTAMIAGIAWIAKSIVKPWSDASLMRSEAFVKHVDNIAPAMNMMATEFHKQSESLAQLNVEVKGQTGLLGDMRDSMRDMGSDQKSVCKAEIIAAEAAKLNVTKEDFHELLTQVKNVQEQILSARKLTDPDEQAEEERKISGT